jgi:hypothetical protein
VEGGTRALGRLYLGAFVPVFASLALAASATADTRKPDRGSSPALKLGYYSQQVTRSRVNISASIAVARRAPGRAEYPGVRPRSRTVHLPVKGGAGDDLPHHDPYPPLAADSALARDPQPAGPGSFWYPNGPGRVCVYAPGSTPPCYTLTDSGGAPAEPALDPAAIAASAAERLTLSPGDIRTSPKVRGLTGAPAWFWLDPAPGAEALTVSLAGETVTVTAEPSGVEWRFGDGLDVAGGPGRPYRPGPPPADAVLHVYETRCLPGDLGRNPYVLESCGSTGYRVEAVVAWRISFTATGPVDASGALATRTTEISSPYPVSEARGFLVSGGSR